ncbi:MAG: hypothetical protein IPJ34_08090 [Myxococcales bacterium]|nr:hypothetical protein [Myxococcales bacterium]
MAVSVTSLADVPKTVARLRAAPSNTPKFQVEARAGADEERHPTQLLGPRHRAQARDERLAERAVGALLLEDRVHPERARRDAAAQLAEGDDVLRERDELLAREVEERVHRAVVGHHLPRVHAQLLEDHAHLRTAALGHARQHAEAGIEAHGYDAERGVWIAQDLPRIERRGHLREGLPREDPVGRGERLEARAEREQDRRVLTAHARQGPDVGDLDAGVRLGGGVRGRATRGEDEGEGEGGEATHHARL